MCTIAAENNRRAIDSCSKMVRGVRGLVAPPTTRLVAWLYSGRAAVWRMGRGGGWGRGGGGGGVGGGGWQGGVGEGGMGRLLAFGCIYCFVACAAAGCPAVEPGPMLIPPCRSSVPVALGLALFDYPVMTVMLLTAVLFQFIALLPGEWMWWRGLGDIDHCYWHCHWH